MITTPSEPMSLEGQCLLHLVCHLQEYASDRDTGLTPTPSSSPPSAQSPAAADICQLSLSRHQHGGHCLEDLG